MAYISKLAWRNIWRNKRRTILTLCAVSLTTCILVFFMALQFSMYDASIRASVSAFQGHLQIQVDGYLDKPQMRLSFANAASLKEKVKNIPEVQDVAIRAQGFALVSSSNRTYGVQIVGVEPEAESHVSTIPSLVRQGKFLEKGDEYSVVIGDALSKNLQIEIGDELTLLGQGRDGSLAAGILKIKGIFQSGVQELDRSLIEMPLLSFQEMFSMNDEVHALVLTSKDLSLVPRIKNEISPIINGTNLLALPWDLLIPGINQAIEFDMTFGWMFYASLIIVVALSILNTFMMSILERTREFGLMLALGMKPINITRLVLRECALLTLLGISVGIVFGGSIVWYFHVNGFYLPGSEEMMKLWNIPAVAYPEVSLACLTIGPAVILTITLLSLIYPVMKLRKFEAVEAMRAV